MAFVIDKEELKPGLILFRRADVDHNNWYCRIKLPKEDRYKTISLKTSDKGDARNRAFDHDADIRFRLKHDVPVFNRSFSVVGEEFIAHLKARAKVGEIKSGRVQRYSSTINGHLQRYVGSTQVHLIGQDKWAEYPTWRRAAGQGRVARPGQTRPLTSEESAALEAEAQEKIKNRSPEYARKAKARAARKVVPTAKSDQWRFVSDDTIRTEMKVFKEVMEFAISKRYVPAHHRFEGTPNFKKNRRDEFSRDEYRHLHTFGRKWITKTRKVDGVWTRTVVYNFILIMCGTGMRPPEARNLRWRDVGEAFDREKRKVMVLHVRGKGKERKLVAPASVGDYLERIRAMSKSTKPDDPVFTNYDGSRSETLYAAAVEDLLDKAGLRIGPSGGYRGTYCFRHTYATFRLEEGIDAYLLAEQMGTSVQMIQEHYGHVNAVKHANLVLHGMASWEPVTLSDDRPEDDVKIAPVAKARSRDPSSRSKRQTSPRVAS